MRLIHPLSFSFSVEPIEFVYYIRKGLLQYGTNGESNGKSVIQWKLCDSSGTDNQVATVTVADLSIQSRYFVDFTDESKKCLLGLSAYTTRKVFLSLF